MANTFREHLQRGIFENFEDILNENSLKWEVLKLLTFLTIENLKTSQSQ